MTASPVGSMSELDAEALRLLGELQQLQETLVDAQTLPDWLRTCSQIKCEIQTLWAQQFLATKRNTNDVEARSLYQHLMSVWMPKLEAFDGPLARTALAAGATRLNSGLALKLEADLEGQHTEQLRNQLAQERLLSGQYDVITANQTVELSDVQMFVHEAQARLKSAISPQEREGVWHAINRSNVATASELDALFKRLLLIRQQVAAQAGSTNYAQHVWRQTNREYTIAEAVTLLDGISEVFAPLGARADRDRATRLGVPRLRPWDLTVSFHSPAIYTLPVDAYVETAERTLTCLDPAFGKVVRVLANQERLDLAPRAGKARGNFAAHLLAIGTSELLCNVSGGVEEFRTLLHELGHAVHSHFLSINVNNLFWDFYNFAEVSEFCAFVFTFLGTLRLLEDSQLSPGDRAWYQRSMAERVLERLRDVDERVRLELWLYRQTRNVPIADIDAHYVTLYHRPGVDWSGHEHTLRKGWQRQHLFLHSFYNIEYSIATVAALLFVKAYQDDSRNAIRRLKRAMSIGATAGPTAIFAQAGITFPFSDQQLIIARDVLAQWLD